MKNKEKDLGMMIEFWIQHKGALDLDTPEQEIIDFYNEKHTVSKLKNNISTEDKLFVSNILVKLISKFERMSNSSTTVRGKCYFSGIADGLNHAYKVINEFEDDYLDGIKL